MAGRSRRSARYWVLLGKVVVLLALLALAWRLATGEWLWVILNGLLQHQLP